MNSITESIPQRLIYKGGMKSSERSGTPFSKENNVLYITVTGEVILLFELSEEERKGINEKNILIFDSAIADSVPAH